MRLSLISVAAVLIGAPHGFAEPFYTATPITGVLFRTYTSGALNDLGQVATTTPNFSPAIWSNGTLTVLSPTMGGASGINNAGQVVGDMNDHAVLYANAAITDLGTLPGNTRSLALGINNAGQIIGYSNLVRDDTHAFLYSNGVMTDLGTLGGRFSIADAINDSGQVVGGTGNFPPGSPGFHALSRRFHAEVTVSSGLLRHYRMPRRISVSPSICRFGNRDRESRNVGWSS